MKIFLNRLELRFRRSVEVIRFEHVNFFWGKIGAGKSSIARLIDFCLGAEIKLTPALQLEFLQATLYLEVAGRPLTIYRERGAGSVVAAWEEGSDFFEVIIPARVADGVVVPGTSIEVLSDLIFHLAGIPAPKVRKGRGSVEPSMVRLSLRDLFRFCYIDQDEIDSDFFRLDLDSDWARRTKSVDAMRFILGYHQELVATLEAELQNTHEQKLAARAAAEALEKVLEESGFSNPFEIETRLSALKVKLEEIREAAAVARLSRGDDGEHAVDSLRRQARNLNSDLQSLEDMNLAIKQRAEDTERHLNELRMLSVRYSRTKTARTLLAAVEFSECPSCTQKLPDRDVSQCKVCGQLETDETHNHLSNEVVEADLKSRLGELQETLQSLRLQEKKAIWQLEDVRKEKFSVDRSLGKRLLEYDSVFLSRALEFERQATVLEQQIISLTSYHKLPARLAEMLSAADSLQGEESELRTKLNRERTSAFKDRSNLESLEELFLDCLVRSSFPGINKNFKVSINPKSFVPEVFPVDVAEFAVTSFANMGSGGMKTIFKACYALALHRLATMTGAALPTLLVMDSAMKNVSERENVELFQAFYKLVYELAASELSETQFVLIDKEMFPVPDSVDLELFSRHMAPGSTVNPPLVPYYNVSPPEAESESEDVHDDI